MIHNYFCRLNPRDCIVVLFYFSFLISLHVEGQQKVLEMDIEFQHTSRHYHSDSTLKILRSGSHWAIFWKANESRSAHWGYEGGDIIGVDKMPLKTMDGEQIGVGYRAHIVPGIEPFPAPSQILAGWLAYCSSSYFKSPAAEKHMLDVPWNSSSEAYEASFDASDLSFDEINFFPKQILWKWDSKRRATINQLRPYDKSTRDYQQMMRDMMERS